MQKTTVSMWNRGPYKRLLRVAMIQTAIALVVFGLLPQAEAASIVLAGDSTVSSGTGWGDSLNEFLLPGNLVTNKAVGGRSTKSFINEGRWQGTLNLHGDFIFIQFGHNDQKLNDPARGTYPIDNPPGVNPGPLDLFRGNLRQMVEEVRNDVVNSGTPVLITPVARRGLPHTSTQAQINQNNGLRNYADAILAVGAEKNVPVIDLNQLSLELYIEMIGNGEDLGSLGPDSTHFNASGATAIAKLVAQAIPGALPSSNLVAVPEPSSLALQIVSCIALALARRIGK